MDSPRTSEPALEWRLNPRFRLVLIPEDEAAVLLDEIDSLVLVGRDVVEALRSIALPESPSARPAVDPDLLDQLITDGIVVAATYRHELLPL